MTIPGHITKRSIDVLDNGFVRLVDVMGSDSSIVQAARISYGSGTKAVHQDEGLIRYLMRLRHTTPFEMCEIKLHVRVPMDCWRQWIRHRSASVNEYSTRYSEAIDACQTTSPNEWRLQSSGNKQGSNGFVDEDTGNHLTKSEQELHQHARDVYDDRLVCGVAREQARKDLPLSTYTEAYWKIDLHNLLHFLALRLDTHAQFEIRQYANAIASIVKEWVPLTWSAFEDYRLNSLMLSARDIFVIQHTIYGVCDPIILNDAWETLIKWGWLEREEDGRVKVKKSREREECELKLNKLGFTPPW